MSHVYRPSTVLAGLSAGLLFATCVVPAALGAGARHPARAQPAQRTVTSTTQVQRTDAGRIATTTATRDDGRTATRQSTLVRDRAAGTRSMQSTATGFNGRTTQYTSEAQRTADGYSRDVTRTLPDGQVNQRSIDVSCNAAVQTCTKTVVGGRGE
jgi:hypothetical protein